MNIELLTCPSGDYEVLIVDNEVFDEGHSIPDFIYHALLEKLGAKFKVSTISDEQMEDGEYYA